jgi:hypothetical protein
MNIRCIALLVCLACVIAHAADRVSLCNADEAAVFSCSIGTKIVSLCATSDLTETTGSLYYRFGTNDRIEMVFPENKSHPKTNFMRGGMMYSGGGGDFVRFQRGAYTYTVYSEFGKGWEREGVTVRKDGRLISSRRCQTPALVAGEGWSRLYKAKVPVDMNRFQEP